MMIENVNYNDPEKSDIGLHEEKGVTLESALAIIGYGKYNISITLACGMAFFAVNTSIYGVAYVMPAAECDLQLDTAQKGLFTSVSFIGVLCSLYVWGALADTNGRKKIILISLVGSFICNLIATFTFNFAFFIILQFLKGVFIAGASSAVFAYLGEFHSNYRRSTAVAWCNMFMAIALTVLPLSAWIILQLTFNIKILNYIILPWRIYLFLCSVPNIIAAALIATFPESPKYLILENKLSEVIGILNDMYVANTNKAKDTCPVKPLETIPTFEPHNSDNKLTSNILQILWNQTVPLFYRDNIKYTAMACMLQFGSFSSSSGLLLWYPHILNKVSESHKISNSSFTICEALDFAVQTPLDNMNCENLVIDDNVFLQNTIIGIAYCVCCFLIGLLIHFVGNRLIIVVNLVIPTVCYFLLTLVTNQLAIDVLFVAVLVPPGLCIGVITAVVLDIFPTQYKAMAVSMALLMGRLGGASSSSLVGMLLELICDGTFYIYGVLMGGCILIALLIPKNKYS